MTKKVNPPRLGKGLSISSHNRALDFIQTAHSHSQSVWPYSEVVRVGAYGGTYILGVIDTGRGYRVWAKVRPDDVPEFPAVDSFKVERPVRPWLNNNQLVRAVEHCILDARAEIRRRSWCVAVMKLTQPASKRAGFWEAMALQEHVFGVADMATMTVEQAELWTNWLARWSAGEVPMPPSRQLVAKSGTFRLVAGPLELYETTTSYWLRHTNMGYLGHLRYFGRHDIVARTLSHEYGQRAYWGTPLFYELLSKWFVRRWAICLFDYFQDDTHLPKRKEQEAHD